MKNPNIQEIKLHYIANISNDSITITSSEEAFNAFKQIFDPNTLAIREEFNILYLNRANKLIGSYQDFKGGITGVAIDLRIIFSIALKCLAVNIIVAHNHPSNNLKPSEEDLELTQKIHEAGKILDINLMDHLILGTDNNYVSFVKEGWM
jgi:DNA repair protein RadC